MSDFRVSHSRFKLCIPRHLLIAGSAWVSRVVISLVQLISVRILISGLGLEQYAVFALLMGLAGWFVLVDFGVGVSAQNYISESRAKKLTHDKYVLAAGVIAIFLAVMTIVLLFAASQYMAPVYLKLFDFLSISEKVTIFVTVSGLMISASVSGIAYKIWYAEHKGYLSNIVPAAASLVGLVSVTWVIQSDLNEKLYYSLAAYLLPTALLPTVALSYQFLNSIKEWRQLDLDSFIDILNRAVRFWFFAIMAAAVLQIDYIVISQFLKANDIAIYNISSKVFGFLFYMYGAMLAALWPVFAEEIANNNWERIKISLRKYISIGVVFIMISSLLLIMFMPFIVELLAPSEQLAVPVSLILLFGFYFVIRIWTDTFAMVLQSMSDLRPFWILVPVQALICVTLQWFFAPHFGLYGILLGLLSSFVLTVSWGLPLAVRRHYRLSLE